MGGAQLAGRETVYAAKGLELPVNRTATRLVLTITPKSFIMFPDNVNQQAGDERSTSHAKQ